MKNYLGEGSLNYTCPDGECSKVLVSNPDSFIHFPFQGYPGYPGFPGAMQQDPLYGYFHAVAGAVSSDSIF